MPEDPRPDEKDAHPPITRWIPSVLLDLSPLEPVFALRTPHRVCLQAMPSSREVLRRLLQNRPFEVCVEVDGDDAPMRHVPVHEVREARLTPDLPLEWDHYYWLVDGLQDDLDDAERDPGAALALGRKRLAIVEASFRAIRRSAPCELWLLEDAWHEKKNEPLLGVSSLDPLETTQQYVRGLTGHLIDRTRSRALADWMAELLREAEHRPTQGLPNLSGDERQLLGMYLRHRLFGNAPLTSPAGIIAGWQLIISSALLGTWFAGLLVETGYENTLNEALVASLWMLDQGFWCDEELVHDVLGNLNASEYTSADIGLALAACMSMSHTRT